LVFDKYENNECKPCQINYFSNNFTNQTSGNVKIDNFIQEKQLKFEYNTIFEWIPYNRFITIKEIDEETGFATAILKDGPLTYISEKGMTRKSYIKVSLRHLHNSPDITCGFSDLVFKLSINLY
jgi:hypothetical protein